MRMLLSAACNPPLSLRNCMTNWFDIASKLREPPRKKRRYQCENPISACYVSAYAPLGRGLG